MKIRVEEKINPLHLEPGDVIRVTEKRARLDGTTEEKVLATDEIERNIELNKIVTFDVEKGDFGEDVGDGIGAALLNVPRKMETEKEK